MPDEPLLLPAPIGPERPECDFNDHQPGADSGGPAESRAQGSASTSRKKSGRRARDPQQPGHPSAEQCLEAMSRLPGLLMMGMLTTPQMNAIRGVFAEILRWHQSAKAKPEERRIDDSALMDALAKNPNLLELLEPILPDDQFEMLARRVAEME